jgi:hypothetical protein
MNSRGGTNEKLDSMSKADMVLWDWKNAHRVPRGMPALLHSCATYFLTSMLVSTTRDYRLEHAIHSLPRYTRFTEAWGLDVLFNPFQEQTKTWRDLPSVGGETSQIENQPWMAFFPVTVDYRGTHFQPTVVTNLSLRTALFEIAPGVHQLNPAISKVWLELEDRLHKIIRELEVHIDFPVRVTPPRFPSEYKYQEKHNDKEAAAEAARRGRNAFSYLAAYLAFLVAFWNKPNTQRSADALAVWLARLLNIDFYWMTLLLRFHPIGNTERVTRLGMRVDFDSPWKPYLPIFLLSFIPVTVSLGRASDMSYFHSKAVWPTIRAWVEGAVEIHDDPNSCPDGPPMCQTCRKLVECARTNRIARENPEEFVVARDEEWNRHCIALNMLADKLIGGRDVSKANPCEIIFQHITVFEWVGIGTCYRRCAVSSGFAFTVIEAYPVSSRFFSPLHNELDLFPDPIRDSLSAQGLLTPIHTNYPDLASDLDQGGDEDTNHHAIRDSLSAQGLPTTSPNTTDLDIASDYDQDEDEDTNHHATGAGANPYSFAFAAPPTPKWKLVIEERLGFTCPPSTATQTFERLPAGKYNLEGPRFWKALEVLGLVPSQWNHLLHTEEGALCVLPVALLSARPPTIANLPTQFDITSRDVLRHLSQFRIERIVHRDGAKTTYRWVIGVRDKPLESQYFVVVVSGTTLVEIARNKWAGILEICRQLALRGIRFSTAVYFPPGTRPLVPSTRRIGLGTIDSTSVFTSQSYALYQEQRDNFLRSRRGALAFKDGGMAARFAKDVVPLKSVLVPPAKSARDLGFVLGTNDAGEVVIADGLEQNELDIILGRYLRLGYDQTQTAVTLWPPPAAWDNMGINTGAWNEAAEDWYQRQLADFSGDSTQTIVLKSATGWRNNKMWGDTRVVWKEYERLATTLLNRVYT